MRRKKEAVLAIESNDKGLPSVVRDYRARYRAISQVLDENPQILDLVHKDLEKLSQGDSRGREGDYTSENILRARRRLPRSDERDNLETTGATIRFQLRAGHLPGQIRAKIRK